MEEKYQLADALSIYDDLNGSLVVLQGKTVVPEGLRT